MRTSYDDWASDVSRSEHERAAEATLRVAEARNVSQESHLNLAGRLARFASGLGEAAGLGSRRTSSSGSNVNKMNVYVVAGFETLRHGLIDLIASEPSTNLVGEAASLERMAVDTRCLAADVLLIDTDVVNSASVSDLHQRLGERMGDLKILFLGGRSDALGIGFENIPLLMRLQAIGFITKDGPTDRLLKALAVVGYGGFVCETRIMKQMAIGVGVLSSSGQPAEEVIPEALDVYRGPSDWS